ncbi:MAG: deoxyribodipyrimidine photo-lyase [Halodesulfurarchaeum sp.]
MGTPDIETIFWHRRDLRMVDNPGLEVATRQPPVQPVFVVEDPLLDMAGPARTRFLRECLVDLSERYAGAGTALYIARGEPSRVLPDLASETGADRVVWNRDYSGYARDRDRAVVAGLEDRGIEHDQRHDLVLHEPRSILTTSGEPYSVFSYYWKKWREREKDEPVAPVGAEELASRTKIESPDPRTTIRETVGRQDDPTASIPGGSRPEAERRLGEFVDEGIFSYADDRDYPASRGTSRLSQDLKFGLLGIREVHQAVQEAAGSAESESERESVEAFIRQLAWREFYLQVLEAHPETITENFQSFEAGIEWETDPEGFEAWKAGLTGYPIVDAGMRQLREEAYMHNRVRMIVASFLTKDLLIDWRRGYRWFRERLVDHDTANDVGGWQWAASTGTDAQPYFRVFNPMTQGERYDPDAEYITEFVPELQSLEPGTIHEWDTLTDAERERIAPQYPHPIVDHAKRREMAIQRFEAARASDGTE